MFCKTLIKLLPFFWKPGSRISLLFHCRNVGGSLLTHSGVTTVVFSSTINTDREIYEFYLTT